MSETRLDILGSLTRMFEGFAESLQTQAVKVADLGRKKGQAGTQVAAAEMGRTTCAACHDASRVPSPRN